MALVSVFAMLGAGSAAAAPGPGPVQADIELSAPAPAPIAVGEASALAEDYWRCNVGQTCVFEHYDGLGWYLAFENTPQVINLLGTAYENKVSSLTNRSSLNMRLYNWTGSCWQLLWLSSPSNWGNIAHVDNLTDAITVGSTLVNQC